MDGYIAKMARTKVFQSQEGKSVDNMNIFKWMQAWKNVVMSFKLLTLCPRTIGIPKFTSLGYGMDLTDFWLLESITQSNDLIRVLLFIFEFLGLNGKKRWWGP